MRLFRGCACLRLMLGMPMAGKLLVWVMRTGELVRHDALDLPSLGAAVGIEGEYRYVFDMT